MNERPTDKLIPQVKFQGFWWMFAGAEQVLVYSERGPEGPWHAAEDGAGSKEARVAAQVLSTLIVEGKFL